MKHPTLPSQQRGAALAVSLILLVVITIVGLASIRGTSMQEKMSSNFLDRSINFQSAEAALRAAEARVKADPTAAYIYDCETDPTIAACQTNNPLSNASFPAANIQTVQTGTGDAKFTAGALSDGIQPQYAVQKLAVIQDTGPAKGSGTANEINNYGGAGIAGAQTEYYRITARSGDPTAANAVGRSIVTLQTILEQ